MAPIPEDIADVIARVASQDPTCTHVELNFEGKSGEVTWYAWLLTWIVWLFGGRESTEEPDATEIVQSLAQALAGNMRVTTLNLCFSPDCNRDEIIAALSPAIRANTSVTLLSVTGFGAVPGEWQERVRFNVRLAHPRPRASHFARAQDVQVDLREAPWAVKDNVFGHLSNRFRRKGRLGGGGFGVVFGGTLKGEPVAAKAHFAFQNPQLYDLADPETRKHVIAECMREISALRRLERHKNVIGFKGVAYTLYQGDVLPAYICMELAKTTLHDQIRAGKARLLPDMLGMACGLDFIHSQGMMHRDLKPANILVDENGEVKIGDLGLVKMAHILNRFGKHTLVGTPSYRAPEVGDDCRDYGSAVDIYALGIISWEIQFKRDPAADHPSRLQQIARAGGAMGELIWLPQRCAATDPELRPSSHGLYLALANVSQG
eukprot:m.220499 g.220499  ORF g.220499 m.220499 type:complete len:433 (-) comp15601_c0_seq12:28-1326(-)